MKIKTLLQAPLILEKAKELNIDLTTLDPNTRVKIKGRCLVFEPEKECFVSAVLDINKERSKHGLDPLKPEEPIKYDAGPEPSGNSEQLESEYYYLQFGDTIQENDQYFDRLCNKWVDAYRIGESLYWNTAYRRKIQKNPTT